MRVTSALLLALSLGVGVAGGVASAEDDAKFVEHPARTSGRDVKIPRGLVKQIEEDYRAFQKKNEAAPKATINRKMLNMSVELWQKNPVALHENTRIVTPLGGGVIDLSEFVTPLRGAFFAKIVAKKEDGSEPAGLRIFFVSKGKRRILEGEEYGSGCGKYMEVTSFYNKKNSGSKRGFELYTADQRYLSVLGGTFVAIAFDKEALSVGTITFTDSRYPDLLCE
jgi:hypothetical protein